MSGCQVQCSAVRRLGEVLTRFDFECGRTQFETNTNMCWIHERSHSRNPEVTLEKLNDLSGSAPKEILNYSNTSALSQAEIQFQNPEPKIVTFDSTSFRDKIIRIGSETAQQVFEREFSILDVHSGTSFQFTNCTFLNAILIGNLMLPREQGKRIGESSLNKLSFVKCKFYNSFHINRVKAIEGFHFTNCKFFGRFEVKESSIRNGIVFSDCEFHDDSEVNFDVLHHTNDSYRERFGEGPNAKLLFRNSNLKGLHLTSLPWGADLLDIEFEGIANWKSEYKRNGMITIRDDEQDCQISALKRIDVYSRLEKYHYDISDFSLASAFYVNLMQAKGLDSNEGRFNRFLNRAYRVISNYGSSVSRVSFLMILLVALTPLFLLNIGTPIDPQPADDIPKQFYYVWTSNPTLDGVKSFWSDYGKVFSYNFDYLISYRNSPMLPKHGSIGRVILQIEFLLLLALLPSLIIAVKRQFTPKQPFRRD